MSVWTKGVRSYLSRTEKVMLVVPSDDVEGASAASTREVSFETIEERLVRVPGLHPVRFETPDEFPDG